MAQAPLYVFWDNSNIYIPAQTVAGPKEPFANLKALRIHFENLVTLVRAGRRIAKGIVVGSVPPDLQDVWGRLKEIGMEVELFERGEGSGREQGVDQCLQVHMLRTLVDEPPAIAVLLTGDGKGYEDGVGFYADLERMYRKGWGIEVYSWSIACKPKLRKWAESAGVYVPLEDYYESITFLEGRRPAKSLTKRKHPIAKVKLMT